MNARRLIAVALIVLGVLALAYRGFNYTRSEKQAQIGGLSLSFKKQERVEVPMWAGVVAIAAGAALLLVRGRS